MHIFIININAYRQNLQYNSLKILYNSNGDLMFKKFYFVLLIFFLIISFIFSSNHINSNNNVMYYPTNNFTTISSPYGYRQLWGKTNFHNGIDFPMPQGSNVYSTMNGTIIYAQFNNVGYGKCIIILHNNGLKSLYGHLSENYIVRVGQTVYSHQLIGYVGPKILSNGKLNGNTTGCHLHFTIFDRNGKTVDPLSFDLQKINK